MKCIYEKSPGECSRILLHGHGRRDGTDIRRKVHRRLKSTMLAIHKGVRGASLGWVRWKRERLSYDAWKSLDGGRRAYMRGWIAALLLRVGDVDERRTARDFVDITRQSMC